MILDVEEIVSAGNVRIDENDVTELATSLDRLGLIQPLVVAASENGDNTYTLIAGHRRLAAAKTLGWDRIEVVVNEAIEDASSRLSAQYAENVHRKNLSAYEKAQVALDLKAEGLKQEEVALELQLTKAEVSKYQKAARTIGVLPNADAAVALSEESLFDLMDEADNTTFDDPEQKSLVLENAMRLIVNGEARNVRAALGGAEREANEARILEHLQPMVEEVYARGGKLDDYSELNEVRGSVIIARHQMTTNFGSQMQFNQEEVEAHRNEECHRYSMVTGGYSGTFLAEWCVKPNLHQKAGKSELKVAGADEIHDRKLAEKQERADAKAAKLDRIDDVGAVLEKFTLKEVNGTDLVAELTISSDAGRVVCKALGLEAEKSEYGGFPKHGEAVRAWLLSLPESKRLAAYALVVLGGDYINGYTNGKPNTLAFFEGRSAE